MAVNVLIQSLEFIFSLLVLTSGSPYFIMHVIPASHKTFLSLAGVILTVQLCVNKEIPGKLTVNPNTDFCCVPRTGGIVII